MQFDKLGGNDRQKASYTASGRVVAGASAVRISEIITSRLPALGVKHCAALENSIARAIIRATKELRFITIL